MWFDSWSDLLRIVVLGVSSYAFLVLTLRISGKRTLAQLNAFDFIVTVAFGSTLATILLSTDVSFAEGGLALAVLAALQFVVAGIGSRVRRFHRIVTASPAVLVRDGTVDEETLRRHRLARGELLAAIRASGAGSVRDVAAAVLETNGTISVISRERIGDGSAVTGLDGA